MSDEHDAILKKLHTLEFLIRDQSARIATLELAVRQLVSISGERHEQLLLRVNTPVEWPDSLRDVLRRSPPQSRHSDNE